MRKFELTAAGTRKDGRTYTLMQLTEVTDFSDKEFDQIADLPVGGSMRFNEESAAQFKLTRVA